MKPINPSFAFLLGVFLGGCLVYGMYQLPPSILREVFVGTACFIIGVIGLGAEGHNDDTHKGS